MRKKKSWKQLLALVLSAALMFTSLPDVAFAAEGSDTEGYEQIEDLTGADIEEVAATEDVDSYEDLTSMEEASDLSVTEEDNVLLMDQEILPCLLLMLGHPAIGLRNSLPPCLEVKSSLHG